MRPTHPPTPCPQRPLRAGLIAAALVGASLLAPPPASAQDELPVVKIFATGGTIANTPDGRIAVEAIIDALPEVEDIAELRVEDITRTGSSSLSWQEFIDTAKAIERTFAEEPEVDAAMVWSGPLVPDGLRRRF